MTRFVLAVLAFALVVARSPAAAADEAPRFQLHLEADSAVKLQRHATVVQLGSGPDEAWDDVCAPPCDRLLSRKGVYRIGGKGLIPSDPFPIPPGDRIAVEAKAGSVPRRTVGIVLFGVASAALLGAATAYELSFATESYTLPSGPNTGWLIATGALATGAIAAAAAAVPLLFGNKTHVEIRGSDDGANDPDLASK